jgi:ADP-ribose pyrophosphatase
MRFKPWKILQSREVYSAPPYLRVDVQQVELPDGTVIDDYHHIEMGESAVVYAQTADGTIVVQRQYRQGVGGTTISLPAGGVEKGEAPVEAARRELLEETGYQAEDWQLMGTFVGNANYGAGRIHIFRASGAHLVSEPESDDLEDTEILLLSVEELTAALMLGEIKVMGAAVATAMGALLRA